MASPNFAGPVTSSLGADHAKNSPVARDARSVPPGEEADASPTGRRTGSRSSWPWWRVRRSLYYPPAPAGRHTPVERGGTATVGTVPLAVLDGDEKEEPMSLKFIGIDPETPGGGCPSVWVDA